MTGEIGVQKSPISYDPLHAGILVIRRVARAEVRLNFVTLFFTSAKLTMRFDTLAAELIYRKKALGKHNFKHKNHCCDEVTFRTRPNTKNLSLSWKEILVKVYSTWSYAFLDLRSTECTYARQSTCFVSRII